MRFSSQSKTHHYKFELKNGETGIVYPCVNASFFPPPYTETKNYMYVVFTNGGVYRITEEEVYYLKDYEFESEEEFCEQLMVAKL